MKRILAFLSAAVICFSMIACGGENALQFELYEVRLMYGESDEYINFTPEPGKFDLEYNTDKNTIVFSVEGKSFKGTLTEDIVEDTYTVYEVKWNKAPGALMDDFVYDTETENKTSLLMVDNEILRPALVLPAGFDYEGRFIDIDMWFWFGAE